MYKLEYNKININLRILNHFWKRVNIPEDYLINDWIWTGNKDKDGYGIFAYRDDYGKPIKVRAHRFSYEYYNGEIPNGLLILHKCDNRFCVNPNHLILGTQQDNIIDMYSKGRGVDNSGENNGMCTIEDNIWIEIFNRILKKELITIQQISNEYNIDEKYIRIILDGRRRKNISNKYNLQIIRSLVLQNEKQNNLARLIKQDLKTMTIAAVSRKYNKHYNVVYRIAKGITYNNI